MRGSEFWELVPEDLGEDYVKLILKAIEDGYAYLQKHTVTLGDLEVTTMCKPLAIGTPRDYVYLYGLSAQACDRIAVALASVGELVMTPTSKVLDALAEEPGAAFIGPHTQTNGAHGMTKAAAKDHNDKVQADEDGHSPCSLLVGYGKTYVLNPRYRVGYACEYWWPVSDEFARANTWADSPNSSRNGYVIQPEQWAHFYLHFWDYSMCGWYMWVMAKKAGKPVDLRELAVDPSEASTVSLHGPLPWVVHPEAPGSEEPSEAPGAPAHPTLRKGDKGSPVVEWQTVLVTAGFSLSPYGADGDFGATTEAMTIRYQRARGLVADGIVGAKTWATAGDGVTQPAPLGSRGEPPFKPLYGTAARQSVWGKFAYKAAPTAGNREAIRITDGWAQKSIVGVNVPQLVGVRGAHREGKVYLHKAIAPQFLALWQVWEDEGLIHLVKSWAGMWVPRFIRGSSTVLSNHAFGTAFDINAPWNPLGAEPKHVGEVGSVRELVPAAWDHGFYWGGDFRSRPDGMHFEAAEVR